MVFEKSKWISQDDNATLILRSLKLWKERQRMWSAIYLFIQEYSIDLTLHLQNHMKTSSSDQSWIWEAVLCLPSIYREVLNVNFFW